MLGLILTRLRRRWVLSFALWLGVIASIGFAGAAVLVQTSAADANLQLFLKSQGASGDITVSESDKNDVFLVGQNPNPGQGYKAFQAVVRERAHSLSGGQRAAPCRANPQPSELRLRLVASTSSLSLGNHRRRLA